MGIDLGTQSLKVCVYTEKGALASLESRTYDFDIPYPGWAEQAPEVWWAATAQAIRGCIDGLSKNGYDIADLKGISFSGQMHGLVMLDSEGQAIRPAILHCDQRTQKTIDEIYEIVSMRELGGFTHNRLSPGFLLASLVWVRDHEPESYRRIHTVLLPKDYIRYRLTGELGTDFSDASGSCAFDIVNFKWADRALSRLGIDTKLMPSVHASDAQSGVVSQLVADEIGLPRGLPVYFGGSDQPLQALGNGVTRKGMFTLNFGTSGQIYSYCDQPILNPLFNTNTFCNVIPGAWYSMGAFMSAGVAHSWFCKKIAGRSDYAALDGEVQNVSAGSGGLIFLPYLMGERTPHMNPDAKGVFHGLSVQHDYRHCIHAVMEGVCYASRECFEVLQDLSAVSSGAIVASGGGAKSRVWLQMQADILERPISVSQIAESASLGAAILAAVGAGEYSDITQAAEQMTMSLSESIAPNPSNYSVYREGFEKYKELYKRVSDLF